MGLDLWAVALDGCPTSTRAGPGAGGGDVVSPRCGARPGSRGRGVCVLLSQRVPRWTLRCVFRGLAVRLAFFAFARAFLALAFAARLTLAIVAPAPPTGVSRSPATSAAVSARL